MEEMRDLTDKQLARLRNLLTNQEKSGVERLADAACLIFIALVDYEVERRAKKGK